jgi:hypothetical protein
VSDGSALFDILPGITLELEGGDPAALSHFTAEYGPPSGDGDADLVLTVSRGSDAHGGKPSTAMHRRHKTIAWRAAISPAAERIVEVKLATRGWPRWFARSLVQGYIVEPLLSVVVAEHGGVLLPAAGVVDGGEAVVLVGRSRSGKSSLTARAAAAGWPILGDDQVAVDATGRVSPFPRRLRFYDDLRATAPEAFGRLSRRHRFGLTVRRAARIASGGFIAPSLAVPAHEIGTISAPVRIGRIALLKRTPGATGVQRATAGIDEAIAVARDVLADQRRHLAELGAGWPDRVRAAADAETAVLRQAFASTAIEHVTIPEDWPAERAVATLSEGILGL